MARCHPWSFLFSLNAPDQIDRGANDSWGVPDVFYDPQALMDFLPGSRNVPEPPPRSELAGRAVRVPEGPGPGCPRVGAAGAAGDLLQQCLWVAGITEQLLEAEAMRDRGSFQPAVPFRSAPQVVPSGAQPALGPQPLLQPFVQHLGPSSGLQLGLAPAQPREQQVMATALPAPQVVLLQQVPQRIILQVQQPGPTTLALLPSPASRVLTGAQGPGPLALKPTGHPHCATLSPYGHQHPAAAAAAQHSSSPTPKAVGTELWHGESFWGLQPNWGKLDSFVSYF
ncbi:unnamed protein product [Coccothraustes coccothraustes]